MQILRNIYFLKSFLRRFTEDLNFFKIGSKLRKRKTRDPGNKGLKQERNERNSRNVDTKTCHRPKARPVWTGAGKRCCSWHLRRKNKTKLN